MGLMSKIAGLGLGEMMKGAGSLPKDLREAFTGDISADDKVQLKAKAMDLEALILRLGTSLDQLRSNVIVAEAQGDSWLQRNWRPITMLTFTALVVMRWLGWTETSITQEVELKLWEIIKIGIGGYIAGRSIEKITDKWKGRGPGE